MTHPISRRDLLRTLGLVGLGVAGACTPLKIVTRAYPEPFDADPDLADRALKAFVLTVVPGASADDPNLARAFADPFYPFARCRGFFTADLASRAARRYGRPAFETLSPAQRTAVIREGLGSRDPTIRRLYNGAILLAQVSVYAGIYDDRGGSPLIGFEGRFRYRTSVSYPDPDRFLTAPLTRDGNPS